MSSTTSTASNNTSSNKPTTAPTSTSNGSEFTQEQWLDLLRVLPSNSRTNLQLALKQFLRETEGGVESGKPEQKISLPHASTLVRASLPQDDMPQNTYGTDRYLTLLRQSLELDRKPLISSGTLETPNGLDTLAAAALANTSTETNVTSTSAVAVLQGKAVPGTGMVAIPITAQMAPALLGGFKTDSSQRQSPTIRETPKRLAATRAEAEQAAATHVGVNEVVKRGRLANENVLDEVDTSTAAAMAASTAANLLLSNGGIPTPSVLKPDPECVNAAYSFHGGGSDAPGNWNLHSVPPGASAVNAVVGGGSGILTENNRRRIRDEGITDDEAARREKRRERNRVAAAKCRQNRQNQIEELKARRKLLEDEGNHTRQLIQNLLHEKARMEELLKKHAQSGCPTAAQYFENGTLLLRLSAAAAAAAAVAASSTSASPSTSVNTTPPRNIRIIQPSNTHQLQLLNSGTAPLASSLTSSAAIKPEAPSSSPTMTFVPAQRPNTLSLVTSTKVELPTPTLDSATASSTTTTQLAAHLWSPSVTAKIKTPGGENWVNSQIGLPPITVGNEKDVTTSAAAATTTALLSTPDILHHFGISLAAAHAPNNAATSKSTPVQICGVEGKNASGASATVSVSSTPSVATTSTSAATANMG